MQPRAALAIVALTIVFSPFLYAKSSPMALVGPGTLEPFYPASEEKRQVKMEAFLLDRYPVTNGEFLNFVLENSQWQRSNVKRLFAESNYLSHWQGEKRLGPNAGPKQPVTFVSWFAAKAYCKSVGKRLPSESEWEFAAQASATSANGIKDRQWQQKILQWYSKPNPKVLDPIGSSDPNFWGVYDLHGLLWEWVLEFNSTMFSVDSRGEGDKDRVAFCGSGSLNASEKENYASFMRIAFRSSLEAKFTVANLGFRCAQDSEGGVNDKPKSNSSS